MPLVRQEKFSLPFTLSYFYHPVPFPNPVPSPLLLFPIAVPSFPVPFSNAVPSVPFPHAVPFPPNSFSPPPSTFRAKVVRSDRRLQGLNNSRLKHKRYVLFMTYPYVSMYVIHVYRSSDITSRGKHQITREFELNHVLKILFYSGHRPLT